MATCVNCGGDLKVQRAYDFSTATFRGVYSGTEVFRCEVCGLSQVDVKLVNETALSDYYAREYRVGAKIGVLGEVTAALYHQRATALADLADWHLGRELLHIFEVGAGYGFNLRELQARHPQARASTDEVSTVAAEHHGAQIVPGQLEDGGFDVIILSHVLEHFTDPRNLLSRARAALSPGGLIVLEVPNDVDNILRYNVCDEPHLTFFEIETLRHLLDSTDFEIAELFAAGPTNIADTSRLRKRRRLRQLLGRVPGVNALLERRGAGRIAANTAYGTANPNGMFLRAVLRKA